MLISPRGAVRSAVVALGAIALAGCQMKPADNTAETTTTTTSGVTRVQATPSPTPAPLPTVTSASIQSQPGPKGSVATLNKIQVTGDILTVQLTITGQGSSNSVPLDQVSLIDDATSQRIGLLKDDAGNWMASPLSGKDYLGINLYESPVIISLKFPAPPASSKTVSLTIPQFGSFDGVSVAR